jgi:effector-binding domain-containing protein
VRLAAIRTVVPDQRSVAAVVGPSFDAIAEIIGHEPGALDSPIAQYETLDDGVEIIAGYAYSGPPRDGFEIFDLPSSDAAVCGIHLGAMDRIAESWHAIHTEVIARGLVHAGACRELYVRAVAEDQSDWVTELQQPVARS